MRDSVRMVVGLACAVRELAGRVWRSGRRHAGAVGGRVPGAARHRPTWCGWCGSWCAGNWRWLVKLWSWATYADLRADARAARLAGDTEARRTAQELIRADAKARWARVGIVLRRAAITARVAGAVAVVLWLVDAFMDRADMWPWLAGVYTGIDAVWTVLSTAVPVLLVCRAVRVGGRGSVRRTRPRPRRGLVDPARPGRR